MLEYDRTQVFEGIDANKTNSSRECIICHYWYFLEINFKLDLKMHNGCRNLMKKVMSPHDVAIAFVKLNDYRIHFWYMSKD